MTDTGRSFAKKHPNLTMLICGLLMCLSAIGVGMNMTTLIESEIIPERFFVVFKNYGWMILAVFELVAFWIGTLLIGLSIVRSLGNKKKVDPISDNPATQN
jgi:hypothetical protein